MSWHLAAGRRGAGALIALSCALCCLGSVSLAQSACRPEGEIFGGYAFLAPNGWGDLDYKINNIPNGFDASNTYYLPNARNLGLLLDGSGHFHGGTTPLVTPQNYSQFYAQPFIQMMCDDYDGGVPGGDDLAGGNKIDFAEPAGLDWGRLCG